MRRTAGALAVFGVLLAGWTVLRAQTPVPRNPGSADIMPALLEEVRGLRASLERMSREQSLGVWDDDAAVSPDRLGLG